MNSSEMTPLPEYFTPLLARLHGETTRQEEELLEQNMAADPLVAKEAEEIQQADQRLRQSLENREPDPKYRLTPRQRTELMTLIGQPTLLSASPREIRRHRMKKQWNMALVWTGGMAAAAMVAVAFLSHSNPATPSQNQLAGQKSPAETTISLAKPEKSAPKTRSPLPAPPASSLRETNLAQDMPLLPPAPNLLLPPAPAPVEPPALVKNPPDKKEPAPQIKPEVDPKLKEQKPPRVMANPLPIKK